MASKFVLLVFMISVAQHVGCRRSLLQFTAEGADIEVYKYFLSSSNGYFVDIGAYDPIF